MAHEKQLKNLNHKHESLQIYAYTYTTNTKRLTAIELKIKDGVHKTIA